MVRRKISLFIFVSVFSIAVLPATGWGLSEHDNKKSSLVGGQWTERTQLVWDEARRSMVRRTLKVWDERPERNLDFYFEPAKGQTFGADAVISGKGVLTWRIRGTASYDQNAVFSRYEGRLVNGRPEGRGRLTLRSGRSYEGHFKNGLMHGQGVLHTSKGDQYEGLFAFGKPHGKGRYAHASGEIYEGAFKAGKRHGSGTVILADGRNLKAVWRNGIKEGGNKPLVLTQWSNGNDPFAGRSARTNVGKIELSVVTDQARYRRMKANYIVGQFYNHKLGRKAVSIQPSDKKLVQIWKGNGWMYDNNNWADGYNPSDDKYRLPVYLQLGLKNKSADPAIVDRIELQFVASRTDRKPFLGVRSNNGLVECSQPPGKGYNAVIEFNNTGWGAAEKASISYAFTASKKPGSIKKYAFKQSVGTFASTKKVSIAGALQKSGINLSNLKKFRFKCPSHNQLKACQREVMKKINLGDLKRNSYFAWGSRLVTNVEGLMSYSWKDSLGKRRAGKKRFTVPVLLASIDVGNPAECGAGGPEDPKAGIPILKLKLDKKNYRLRYPLRKKLRLTNRTKILPFAVKVNKSSNHLFRVVVRFKDGAKKISKPIKLLYARPRKRVE